MKTALLCLLALNLSLSATQAEEVEWPLDPGPLIYSSVGDATYPVWVQADAAELGTELDDSLFHPDLIKPVLDALAGPAEGPGGCVMIPPRFQAWTNPPDLSSLEHFASQSKTILLAEVLAQQSGFDRGIPSTLYSLQIVEVLKGEAVRDTYVITVPNAEFAIAGKTLCSQDRRYAAGPKVGGEVLLSLQRDPDKDSFIDHKFPQAIISITTEGEVSYPTNFEAPEGTTDRDAVISFVRSTAKTTDYYKG